MSDNFKIAKMLQELLLAEGVLASEAKLGAIGIANAPGVLPSLAIANANWFAAAQIMLRKKMRLVALWGQEFNATFEVNAAFENSGEYLVLRTATESGAPSVSSIAAFYPAANRLERHLHDMFGVVFLNTHDNRRWTRHQAWSKDQFPLRKEFAAFPKVAVDVVAPPDSSYSFYKIDGDGVYEIPVGPIHAGIIEPGHFRFHAAGEDVMNLEERLGYVHKGIEKIAVGKTVFDLVKLAGRVSGDSTVAYAWSASQACENACGVKVPERALFIRAILLERERVANHLGDIAAISNDVAFTFAYYQLMRLKELWLRVTADVFKHRFMMDLIIPGGVTCDIDAAGKKSMQEQIKFIRQELQEIYPLMEASSTYHDRLKTAGVLSRQDAVALGVLGYVARASGVDLDLRKVAPYAPYDQVKMVVPLYDKGDVLARTRVRAQELLVSLELLEAFLEKLPSGPLQVKWPVATDISEGVGLVEGFRGEVFSFVRLGADGKVERYFPRDPSWFSWPALERLIHGNIVPDFPVCNKSINGSYSGVDL